MRKRRVRRYNDPTKPHLKFYVGFRESGRRARKFFETKDAAENFAAFKNKEREENGREHAEFPTWLRVMAQKAVEKLRRFPAKTITDAVDHYVAYLDATEKSCSVEQLVTELLEAREKDGVGKRHWDDLKNRLRYFNETFGERIVATITSPEINDWLRSLDIGPQTRNHYRAAVVQLFGFADACGYAPTNPTSGKKIARAKLSGDAPPGILTVEQASALLVHAPKELVPYLSIGLFAGLRRTELERLDWSEVDFESGLIQVTAAKSKTAQRRFVKIEPNLREWLQPYRKLKGEVTPLEGFRQLFEGTRIAAGITEWPDNALRHSFASYHLAAFNDAALTALQMGHYDSRLIFRHYRQIVRPRDGERYFNLKPMKRSRKIVSMP
jgi:integrase